MTHRLYFEELRCARVGDAGADAAMVQIVDAAHVFHTLIVPSRHLQRRSGHWFLRIEFLHIDRPGRRARVLIPTADPDRSPSLWVAFDAIRFEAEENCDD